MRKIPNEHIAATHWPCGIEWNNSKSEPNRGFEFHEHYHPESIDLLNHYQGYDYNENQSYQNNSEEVENIESSAAPQEFKNEYDPNYPEF